MSLGILQCDCDFAEENATFFFFCAKKIRKYLLRKILFNLTSQNLSNLCGWGQQCVPIEYGTKLSWSTWTNTNWGDSELAILGKARSCTQFKHVNKGSEKKTYKDSTGNDRQIEKSLTWDDNIGSQLDRLYSRMHEKIISNPRSMSPMADTLGKWRPSKHTLKLTNYSFNFLSIVRWTMLLE